MDESYSAYRHSPFYPNGLIISWNPNRMRWSSLAPLQKVQAPLIVCKKRERERDQKQAYKVIEITPPPKHLGIRCFAPNLQCGESVTIEGQTYTISAVTHRYQLRKGKYEPSEKRLDVLSTGRHILNLYFENLLQKS